MLERRETLRSVLCEIDPQFSKKNEPRVLHAMILSDSDVESSFSAGNSSEVALFQQTHNHYDQITSGYSTISSGKEEAYLTRHMINSAAVKAAQKNLVQIQNNQLAKVPPENGQEVKQRDLTGKSATQGDKKFEGHNEASLEALMQTPRF